MPEEKKKKHVSVVIGGKERILKPTFANINALEEELGMGYPAILARSDSWTLKQLIAVIYHGANGNEANRVEREEVSAELEVSGWFYIFTPAMQMLVEFGGSGKEEKKDATPQS